MSTAEKQLRFMVGDANLVNTHLQGHLDVPFSRVVKTFGEPGEADGYKIAFQWRITFSDGTVASIYDYKASSLYGDGGDAPTPEQMRANEFSDWHVGGINKRALELVREALTSPNA
jgi:hypothetical protein